MSFHIVIAGDFAGANSERPSKPLEIDRDNIEAVLGRVRPSMDLPLRGADGEPLSLSVSALDDFHPDRLHKRLPVFAAIEATADEPPPAPPPAAPAPPPKPAGGFLDDILSTTEERLASTSQRSDWDEALHRIATGHAQPKPSAEQERREGEVQKARNLVMRAILQSPRFRAVESAWRGLDFLVRRLDTDGELRIFLLDVSKGGLAERLARAGDEEWNVVLANYTFGPGEGDIAALRNLARSAAAAEIPVIAAAHPLLLGCEDAGALSDPSEWKTLPEGTRNSWAALRRGKEAAWIGLALPRMLSRLPYGAAWSECDDFAFEEIGPGVTRDDLAWANPVFACGAMLGQSWLDYGEADARRELDGMLSFSWREGGEARFQPAGEVALTDRAVEAILERGLIPVMTSKHGGEVRIPRFQSLAYPPLPLEFPG